VIDGQLVAFARTVDREIEAVVAASVDDPWTRSAISYHLGWADMGFAALPPDRRASGGKKLRPAMVLLCYQGAKAAFGPSGESCEAAVPFAAAVELVHNFSLIHDDIEDGDRTRRGRPTLWSLCGEGPAVQVGNTLLALAFICLGRLHDHGVAPRLCRELVATLSDTVVDLTTGQHRDMAYESADTIDGDMYVQMIAGKTGALAACATYGGAMLAQDAVDAVDPSGCEQLGWYRAFGMELGLAYQIRDDILGIWGDQSETGKSQSNDIRCRKKTYPIVFAFTNAAPDDCERLHRLYGAPEELTGRNELEIRRILAECGAQPAAQSQVEWHAEQARHALAAATGGSGTVGRNDSLAILDELAGSLTGRSR
jgi:geranylgeranyl diphosphate synthase type I